MIVECYTVKKKYLAEVIGLQKGHGEDVYEGECDGTVSRGSKNGEEWNSRKR